MVENCDSYKISTLQKLVFLLLLHFSFASMYYPESPDDENIVNSEGQWQKESQTIKPPTKIFQGASRFDVGGILTAIGLKQGASLFTLVVFPILFPLMILLAIGMFVISMFGSGGLAVAGKRSDLANSNAATFGGYTPGYKLSRYGHTASVTNRDDLAFDSVENDTCIERFACEILLRGGSKVIGKKTTLEVLRGLNVRPVISSSSQGMKPRKVWNCSSLNCNWDSWIPWSKDTSPNSR